MLHGDSKAGVSPEEIEEAKQLLEVDAWLCSPRSFESCFFVSLCFPPFPLWGAGSFF